MKNKLVFIIFGMMVALLVACGSDSDMNNNNVNADDSDNELKSLDVDFTLPETADIEEEVTLEASVTYGGERVDDADEVKFEYWVKGDKDNSTMVDAENNKDGTYTKTVTFDEDAIYEVYAHTTARESHTMPKEVIKVGDVKADVNEEEEESEHIDGFSMDFIEPESVIVDVDTELIVDIELNDTPLEEGNVRFEVWQENKEKHEWIDATETSGGEYTGAYPFPEEGTYSIQIHVKDDADLHEHEVVTVEATK